MLRSINEIVKRSKHPNTDSPIEEILYQELLKYCIKPEVQYRADIFLIDLAYPEIKLAIEADGNAYHSSHSQKARDKYRQDRLEKLGWTFERFTGSYIHKFKESIAAKIALKYFKKKLTKEQEKTAVGKIVNYFVRNDRYFAIDLTELYLKKMEIK